MSKAPSLSAPEPQSVGEAALSAVRSRREEEEAERVAAGEGLTSLNRLLQWGAANTAGPDAAAEAAATLQARNPEQLKEDREWLDAAFPDMFADVKKLSGMLSNDPEKQSDGKTEDIPEISDEDRIEILESLEEYMADLNYATNITKLGTLSVVVENAAHANPDVRAAALWVLATSMQNHSDVKAQVIEGGGIELIVRGLNDTHSAPRAKACMAASALLKHADSDIRTAFVEGAGLEPLKNAVVDSAPSVRRKALFFLKHAAPTGQSWFVDEVLKDSSVTREIVAQFARGSADDDPAVVAFCGALTALAQHDRTGLLEIAPSLPGVVGDIMSGVRESETRDELDVLRSQLFSSIP